jgi:hypothetical protein
MRTENVQMILVVLQCVIRVYFRMHLITMETLGTLVDLSFAE